VDNLLLAAADINALWFAFPLIVTVSLVYSATRHEQMMPILTHALRIGVWIVGFMAVIFVLLLLLSW
jgi:Na+/alanine symporter